MNAIPALVVGTGFGCRVHVPALRAAGFEVVGLVGTNAERPAAHFKCCKQGKGIQDHGRPL
jgi:predicted dehydrogenase